jgi:23S rRNA (uridine2552-2'-O)-methyltransferase
MGNTREKADFYTKKAKQAGYPARSVYKLEEIQNKHHLIKQGDCVLDIGAAPGSWSLYTQRQILKGTGQIVAVDLKPIEINPIPKNLICYTGDAFSESTGELIASHGPYDVIISDAAPSTTGNRSVDTLRSENLAESVIDLAQHLLKPHGNLVIKIFQGGGEQELIRKLRTQFSKVKPLKPKASRSDSFEVFLIGLDKRKEQ